ncbi:MAG: EamA family transporter RarD [Myxococcales bacterium]|nr:EamA family transporter RarD [Myxococcales bacterium]
MESGKEGSGAGVAYALGAYTLWGITPIYWKLTNWVPADELLAPRVLWTALLMLGVLAVARRSGELRWALAPGQGLWTSLAAALLLGFNWLIFIYAVQTERLIHASLGYYINPLVSVVLGLVVLRERLTRLQGLAVGMAVLGVIWLVVETGVLPWISLLLAVSFALYGLIHKLSPKPPRAGLALEMWLLTPLAIGYWLWLALQGKAVLVEEPAAGQLLIAVSALVSAAPLLCFHAATRRLPLVSVGMFQYLAPTVTLLLALFLYAEPFQPAHLAAFAFVWAGLVCFAVDALRTGQRQRDPALPLGGESG